jgi:hypothetical protein
MSKRLAIVLTMFTATAGCLTAPGDAGEPALGTADDALSTPFANDKAAYDFFVAKGLTSFQAAGIVGNLDQESGVNPGSVQSGGPGRGIAQWSVGGRWDTSHNANVLWYAGTQSASPTSLNLQLEFIWWELTNVGYGFSQLKATTNVTDATTTFMARYEICGTCASAQRIAYAKGVLAAYGATPSYGAAYVSQSWPLASTALTIHCGETIAAKLTVKNTGGKAWDGNTRLGTTVPRDRASGFAGPSWLAPSRPAAISGAVAPGADGVFHFTFTAPSGTACVPGTYHEHFGLLEEGVTWFSDTAQGGPPDGQIEALLDLVPAPPGGGSGGGNGRPAGATTLDEDAPLTGDAAGAGCAAGGGGGGIGVALLLLVGAARRRRGQ